jgi:predicted ATPase
VPKITFKNIALIKNAEIKLDGLTVIAGENNTGKSTIGKLIFTLIKSEYFSRDRYFKENRNRYIELRVNEIRNVFKLFELDKEVKPKLSILPKLFWGFFKLSEGKRKQQKEKILALLDEIEEISKHQLGSNEYAFNKIKSNIERLKLTFDESAFRKRFRQLVLKRMIETNFYDQIVNKYFRENKAEIIYGPSKTVIERHGSDEKVIEFGKFTLFKDSTMVETPVILQVADAFGKTLEFGYPDEHMESYPYTFRDLILKIKRFKGKLDLFSEEQKKELLKAIEEIVQGSLTLDNERLKYAFMGKSFDILSTATGIKSFTILHQLIDRDFLTQYKFLLIVDEPEVHLHPQWQIEYAKILVKLAELGVTVLITTHSPYMVEALDIYSKKRIEKLTNFYLFEKKFDERMPYVEVVNVTDRLDKIFEKLYVPLEKLEREAMEL